MSGLIKHIKCIVKGEWSCGCEFYKGKPMLSAFHTYYDGYMVVVHVGPFWLECDY